MDLSIITACYNHGEFLDDMLNSVSQYKWSIDYEHIIIDDGSTDLFTQKKLKEIKDSKKAIVIHQENSGLAKARNAALKISKGKFILPLDSDNKIRAGVFEKAVNIMRNDDSISVTYTNVLHFGHTNKAVVHEEPELSDLFVGNRIDACALIAKAALDELGWYDENMPVMGNEDWELWLRFISHKKKFFHLNEIGFDYRVLENSMSATQTFPNEALTRRYLLNKYPEDYYSYLISLFNENNYNRNYLKNPPVDFILKTLWKKIANRLRLNN